MNVLNEYEVDTTEEWTSPSISFDFECECGASYSIHIKVDYTRPVSVNLEAEPEDGS